MAAVLRDAQALEASTFADATVATDGLAVEQVARRVLERVPDSVAAARAAPGEDHAATEDGRVSDANGPVLWLHGAPAVGKSTIGWQLFMEALGKGTAAFVDLAQLVVPSRPRSTTRGCTGSRRRTWPRSGTPTGPAGARSLVVTGGLSSTGDLARYRTALPHVELPVVPDASRGWRPGSSGRRARPWRRAGPARGHLGWGDAGASRASRDGVSRHGAGAGCGRYRRVVRGHQRNERRRGRGPGPTGGW